MRSTNRGSRFLLNLIAIITATPMFLGVAVSALTPLPAAAEDYGLKDTACKAGLPCGDVSAVEIVAVIIQTVVGIAGALAVIMLLYGGFLWLTSAGNEEKVKKARTLITNAVIGLVIILTAFSVSTFVFNVLKRATIAPTTTNQDCPGICLRPSDSPDPNNCTSVSAGDASCVDVTGDTDSQCYIDKSPNTCP